MRHEEMLAGKINSLLKLHEQRVRQAEVLYREKRKACDEARDTVEERKESIADLKIQFSAVFRYLEKIDVLNKPLCHARAHTHRYWLEYDLEENEYYLQMDQETLDAAETAMNEACKLWLQARARKSGMEKLLAKQKKKTARYAEYRLELELEESTSNRLEE